MFAESFAQCVESLRLRLWLSRKRRGFACTSRLMSFSVLPALSISEESWIPVHASVHRNKSQISSKDSISRLQWFQGDWLQASYLDFFFHIVFIEIRRKPAEVWPDNRKFVKSEPPFFFLRESEKLCAFLSCWKPTRWLRRNPLFDLQEEILPNEPVLWPTRGNSTQPTHIPILQWKFHLNK